MKARDLIWIVPIVLAITALFLPLWKFRLTAVFLAGKWLEVSVYPIDGIVGDVENVNVVNHYVGLRPIGNSYVPEIRYLPIFYVTFTALLSLTAYWGMRRNVRLALIMHLASTVLLVALLTYVYYWLYNYTHDISPDAPIKMEPFDPPFLGEYHIANFVVLSVWGESMYAMIAAVVVSILSILVLLRNLRVRTS